MNNRRLRRTSRRNQQKKQINDSSNNQSNNQRNSNSNSNRNSQSNSQRNSQFLNRRQRQRQNQNQRNIRGQRNLSSERFSDNSTNSSTSQNDTEDDADQGLMNFLRVSVEDDDGTDGYIPLHQREYRSEPDRYYTYFLKYLEISFKYGLMVILMTMNFVALSLSLNCNAGGEFFHRVFSAIFAFFFGFIYILVNYYTYRVLSQGKICKMNKEKLFPFNA